MSERRKGDLVPTETISLSEAAERLGVHYMTAYRYVRTGRLPAVKHGVEWRVDPADVAALARPGAPGAQRSRRSRRDQARHFESRLVAGDEAGAWSAIEAALASGMAPAEVYGTLLAPALQSIGDRWASGELDVADEHRASSVALRLIGRLGPRFRPRGRKRGSVVVGAPPGERHGLPTAIVADLLRDRGYEVIDLGADTPAPSFVHAAGNAERLRLVGIAVTLQGTERIVEGLLAALRDAGIAVPLAVGGAGIPSERDALALGADLYTGRDGRQAAALIDDTIRGGASGASGASGAAGAAGADGDEGGG